eukprot:4651203-Amphidinium_carterae.1
MCISHCEPVDTKWNRSDVFTKVLEEKRAMGVWVCGWRSFLCQAHGKLDAGSGQVCTPRPERMES